MATITPEMEDTRFYLAGVRRRMEAAIMEATSSPPSLETIREVVRMQEEFMELLIRYVDAGGIILAAPLYKIDCTLGLHSLRPSHIHLFSKYVERYRASQVPPNLEHLRRRRRDSGVLLEIGAVQNQHGDKFKLERLVGPPGERGEDWNVWKWMFCDLGEGEDVNTVVRNRGRWGWGGKFALGPLLERGEQWGSGWVLGDEEQQVLLL